MGFTRLRATRSRQNVAWLRGWWRGVQHASTHPTRLVGVELATGRLVAEVDLESWEIHALFGVVDAGEGLCSSC